MSGRWNGPSTVAYVAARGFIRGASLLVPSERRSGWAEEWQSELWHLLESGRGGSRPKVSLFAFCRGVVPHALWERRASRRMAEPRTSFGSSLHDLRYALRSFRTTPSFLIIAVLTLGIGIGATTAIFSVVDGVLLRPLPYLDPARLVVLGTVWRGSPRGISSTSAPNFFDWKERSTSFTTMAGVMNWQSLVLYGNADPERVRVAHVSEDLFSLLGIGPTLGRSFLAEEYELGSEPVAILSYQLWQRRFGGDEGVLGKTIVDAEKPFTVVGVMPAGLRAPEALWVTAPDLWMPVDFRDPEYASRGRRIMRVVARLKPNASLEAAREEMDQLASALIEAYPEDLVFRGMESRIGMEAIHRETVGDVGERLYVLLGAVVFLLLIACANVANLTLARGTSRSREMALRTALGAGRGRLVRQLLTESLLIALLGGVIGIVLAHFGVRIFSIYAPGDIPRLAEVTLDRRILVFTLAVSAVTGVVFSLAPIFQSAHHRVGEALKDGVQATLGGGRGLVRKSLVVTETALALMLLLSAGLLMNSFLRLSQVDPGFDPENVFAVPVRLDASYSMEERDRFFRELTERLGRLPRVESASAVMNLPIGDVNWRVGTFAEGAAGPADGAEPTPVNIRMVYPDYFNTLGIRLLQGRDFTPSDREAQAEVGIVNESLARLHWPGGEVLGKRLRIGFEPDAAWVTVVGVVNDVRQAGLATTPIPELYRPYPQAQQDWMSRMHVVLKHRGNEGFLAAAARHEVRAMDPKLALSGLGSLEARVSDSVRQPRFYSYLLTSFALLALILAAAGIYGTVLYSVGQRVREVGIRMALGARAGDVTRMILAQAMLLVAIGIGAGLAGAFVTSKLLSSFLFGVAARDLPTFTLVALILAGVGLLACVPPARRAARTDPVTTLRAE